ncbi:hypothetical protein LTR17_004749 [Elasticomyces elasticus]|nr:hypothetical protein LTR17_004749 [Elasticomyces elasticus]
MLSILAVLALLARSGSCTLVADGSADGMLGAGEMLTTSARAGTALSEGVASSAAGSPACTPAEVDVEMYAGPCIVLELVPSFVQTSIHLDSLHLYQFAEQVDDEGVGQHVLEQGHQAGVCEDPELAEHSEAECIDAGGRAKSVEPEADLHEDIGVTLR